jgi:DNA-binding transcriptional MerR regulator
MPDQTIHTVGTLARLCGVPVHAVEYVIRTRGIAPVGRAGNARLYDEAAARWVASELQRIADDRRGGCR